MYFSSEFYTYIGLVMGSLVAQILGTLFFLAAIWFIVKPASNGGF